MSCHCIDVAAQLLAGFCANPAVFAENPMSGWALVNATDDQLVTLATIMADKLIAQCGTV